MKNDFRQEWEDSYERLENTLFYPGEEVVRFVNRYIRRRTGPTSYSKEFDSKPVFLDLGSGAGRHLVFLQENGFFPIGLELSAEACRQAQALMSSRGIGEDDYRIINASSVNLDLPVESVDYAMSVSVLDSMPTATAVRTLQLLHACLKPGALLYADLISQHSCREGVIDDSMDQIVSEHHEAGTVQSYYDQEKIDRVFTGFDLIRQELHTRVNANGELLEARWHLVARNRQ
ncbi:MAG: class I SAM-dependent methyltransferase [Granulosicoccus sp.]|nr:class I SAM-dependent methyltransferase [Granulosicoccus sp.]